ncbi:MAG: cob(I)yrinic acid a,c-diamide adenosyltransferase [Patescibacteria group bacterium]|nr:cob(I)yrinic acid a,c-diamide adenosyltransferase [Patescibacteria group bacterium]MDD5490420.1 cob(I)yrinic acid a,c-diamide adenosyltransferase [Patescibacteria group bacterium]
MATGKGYIQVYTGKGKGKTTASLGLLIRALGRGRKVAVVYFDKGGENYGEREILRKLGVEYFATGLDRVNPRTREFRFGVLPEDIKEAERGLKIAEDLFTKNYNLIILDELGLAANLKMLPVADIIKLLDKKPEHLELVITGRDCPQEILDSADLITEMKLIKHYFYQGVPAREGIEY